MKFTERVRYYEAFDGYYRDDSSAPMVNMVAEGIQEHLEQANILVTKRC